MHRYIHNSAIHNSQDMATTQMSINRWMDKDDVLYTHTTEYNSARKKNEMTLLAATWMELEIIILSEVSQEKDSYRMISLICEIGNLTHNNLSMKWKWTHRYRE